MINKVQLETVTIAAQLANSTTLVGQCAISHPRPSASQDSSMSTPLHGLSSATLPSIHPFLRIHFRRDSRTFDTPDESAPPTRSHSSDRLEATTSGAEGHDGEGNLAYRKGEDEAPLEAKIERIFYINLYGQVGMNPFEHTRS